MTKSKLTRPAPVEFTVRQGDRQVQLTYQQVFAAGHKLWLRMRYSEAAQVFEHISSVTDRGPRAHILLAHCKAMLGDYAGCSSTLSKGLPTAQYGNADSDLHESFVMWKCSFYSDVRAGLEKVIAEHPELPTPCLLLSELLMHAGNLTQPPILLQQAIDRDRPDGAIAAIAKSELPQALQNAATMNGQQTSHAMTSSSKGPAVMTDALKAVGAKTSSTKATGTKKVVRRPAPTL